MKKKHIITIAGKLGAGKSSTAKMVSKILGYEHASTGDFMRAIANKRNVSLEELSKISETDKSIDTALDNYNREIGNKENIVLDSRLGFYFIPESFKVFLELDPAISAKRILEDKKDNPDRGKEGIDDFDTVEKITRSITERLKSEKKRYKEFYEIEDHTTPENFNLVIDTAMMSLEAVSNKIAEEYKKWLKD